jgi:hypothetical protein
VCWSGTSIDPIRVVLPVVECKQRQGVDNGVANTSTAHSKVMSTLTETFPRVVEYKL